MLLRDDRMVALDCVIVNAKKAADVYEDAAAIAQDPETTALFEGLSRRRDAMAEALEGHVRAMGDLPSDPDVESETVGQMWRHLKAALSSDERQQLLAEAATLESQLTTCIDSALATELAPPVLDDLRRFQEEVAADRGRLASIAGAPGTP